MQSFENSKFEGLISIRWKNNSLIIEKDFEVLDIMELSIAPHGDAHHYLKLLTSNLTPLSHALCNTFVNLPPFNQSIPNCLNPEFLIGQAMILKQGSSIKS